MTSMTTMTTMTAMRVLVTGGAGFIGGHIVGSLLDDGHEVRVLDALLPAAWGDSTPEHQAAMVGLGVDLADLPEYAGNNDLGTAVVLAGMAAAGVARMVLASSMVVYGEGRWLCPRHGDVRPGARTVEDLLAGEFEPHCPDCGDPLRWALVEENASLDPRSVYAASKVAQEHLSTAWQRGTGGSVVMLRYHNVYGPRMPRDTPYSGVAAIFRSALERGEAPRVFEDGAQMRDFVHVTDVARANVLALGRSQTGVVTANVCSGEPHSIGDLARTLSSAYGGPEPVVTGDFRLGDVRHVVASPSYAQEVLGFRAQVGFEDGVSAFAHDPLR
jgi:dTDP-L-rhamnose 4-epimerase